MSIQSASPVQCFIPWARVSYFYWNLVLFVRYKRKACIHIRTVTGASFSQEMLIYEEFFAQECRSFCFRVRDFFKEYSCDWITNTMMFGNCYEWSKIISGWLLPKFVLVPIIRWVFFDKIRSWFRPVSYEQNAAHSVHMQTRVWERINIHTYEQYT